MGMPPGTISPPTTRRPSSFRSSLTARANSRSVAEGTERIHSGLPATRTRTATAPPLQDHPPRGRGGRGGRNAAATSQGHKRRRRRRRPTRGGDHRLQ
eukprot:15203190-Alexandrium_andersonii.AAC.1